MTYIRGLIVAQYHCCWKPGSLHHHATSSNDINFARKIGQCLSRDKISTTCVIWVPSNDQKCKYIFMFSILDSMAQVNYKLLSNYRKHQQYTPTITDDKVHRSFVGWTGLHEPRLWFITGGYLVKRWFIPAAARARGQSNDLDREILASNLFNCHKEVINAPPVPSISRCIHIVYQHKNVWEYQWSNFIHNCMSTFLHYVHCKDALLDYSAPGGERCESLTWVDEILPGPISI